MSATPGAITDTDIDEFVRTYSRPDGWRGAIGLYQSMLQEGDEIATLVAGHKLNIPVLAIGAGGGEFTFATMSQVSSDPVRSVTLEGVGHYAALEAPDQVAHALLDFFTPVTPPERRRCSPASAGHRSPRCPLRRTTPCDSPQQISLPSTILRAALDFKRLRFVLLSS